LALARFEENSSKAEVIVANGCRVAEFLGLVKQLGFGGPDLLEQGHVWLACQS
jgi:hypothetical protein